MRIDPRIKELGVAKYREYRTWFDQRLDDAIKAAESHQNSYQKNSSMQSESINESIFFILDIYLSCLFLTTYNYLPSVLF